MPNYVKNIVKMNGIENLSLYSIDKSGEKYFDFNKIIPMPESLDVESGSITDKALVYFVTERCTIPIECLSTEKKSILKKLVTNCFNDNWLEEVFRRVMVDIYNMNESEKNDYYKKGSIYFDNYIKYGHTTWYDWCVANWGTKWNAMDSFFIDENTIEFDTAWDCSLPIIKKISEMYPEIQIEYWWADEDIGNNTGYGQFFNSKMYDLYGNEVFNDDDLYLESNSNDAYANYEFCWGENEYLSIDDNGNYYLKDL